MTSLRLSDEAFGTVGLTIGPNLDLGSLSADLNAILGVPIFLNNLDVAAVTETGLTAAGRLSEDFPIPGSTLTVGGFSNFFFGPTPSITGFTDLAFTGETIAAEGGAYFDIGNGSILSAVENSLRFDDFVNTFDFSATGTAPLEIFLSSVAPFDDAGNDPYTGYLIIGNDGDNVIRGSNFSDAAFLGSNRYVMGAGTNVFLGNFDDALVEGGPERDELFGGQGVDTLLGGAGNDILFGGNGDDVLDGGAGSDILYASAGDDSLTGGAGRDRFVFANDYDIATSAQGQGTVQVNTGLGVSSGGDGENISVLEDFTVGEDLVVFAPTGGNEGYRLVPGTGFDGESQISFQVLDTGGFPMEEFVVEDVSASVDTGGVLVRLEQAGEPAFFQSLDSIFDEDTGGLAGAVSIEVAFTDPGQSTGGNLIDFFGLSTLREPDSGLLGGQDKFDFTALGLTEFRLDPAGPDSRVVLDNQGGSVEFTGAEESVKDILFNFIDADLNESFMIDELSELGGSEPDFFLDQDAGVYRPVHVEYGIIEGDDVVVYADTNANGAYDYETDLAFRVIGVSSDNPFDLMATDLYNDPLGDGSGTGIFIFNEEQYELWFNDAEFVP